MHRFTLVLLFFVFSFLFCVNSYSLTEVLSSTSQMANSSTEIVVAKCVKSEARLDEKTGFVFTYTTFEVDQTVKNTMDTDKFEIRIVGGQVGNIRTDVQGVPKFNEQEEMVLFLGSQNRLGYYTLSSVLNGMYKIEVDETTGRKVIKNPPVDMDLQSANSRQPSIGNTMLLEDFISELKESL